MRIRVHYSWALVFALVTAIVTTQFSENYPILQRIVLGLTASFLFLGAAIIRELILSITTFRGEKSISKITLYAFGGAYPENKARIAIPNLPLLFLARYLSNLVIAVIFYGLYATFINADNLMLAGVVQWLSYIYFLLFLLHFIPAFPLDGGEILRLSLWKKSGNYYQATQLASFIGWIAGLVFIFIGVLVFINTQQLLISLTLIAFGWIILLPAGNTQRHISTMMGLSRIKAQDILTREYPSMAGQVNIGQLIREYILLKGWQYVIVIEDMKFKGILTLKQITAVPEKHWNKTTIENIMTPADQISTTQPQQTADFLFEEMSRRNIDNIPVLEGERFVGVVTLDSLKSAVKVRASFGI